MRSKLSGYVSPEYLLAMEDAFQLLEGVFAELSRRSKEELILPDQALILRAFKETALSNVGVVILGKEPYNMGAANGLAWDTLRGIRPQPCLSTVIGAIRSEYGDKRMQEGRSYLDHLPAQGVLLLNRALTSAPGKKGAHKALWDPFFQAVVNGLNKVDNIVWSLWGSSLHQTVITNPTHIVLKEPNPSTLDVGGFGPSVFSNINSSLTSMGRPPIEW